MLRPSFLSRAPVPLAPLGGFPMDWKLGENVPPSSWPSARTMSPCLLYIFPLQWLKCRLLSGPPCDPTRKEPSDQPLTQDTGRNISEEVLPLGKEGSFVQSWTHQGVEQLVVDFLTRPLPQARGNGELSRQGSQRVPWYVLNRGLLLHFRVGEI